jgi:hypothetical protein
MLQQSRKSGGDLDEALNQMRNPTDTANAGTIYKGLKDIVHVSFVSLLDYYLQHNRLEIAKSTIEREVEVLEHTFGVENRIVLLLKQILSLILEKLGLEHTSTLDIRSVGDLDVESDTVSDLSEVSSTFSTAASLESDSSLDSIQDVYRTASEHLAELLTEDTELRSLYSQALIKFGKEQFSRNHDRLLKKLLKDLRPQTHNQIQLQTIRILRRRTQRGQVTGLIYTVLNPVLHPSNAAKSQAMQILQEQKPDRQHYLNRLLQKDVSEPQAPEQLTTHNVALDGSEESSSDDGGDESIEDGDDGSCDEGVVNESSQQLNAVVTFLTQGAPFDQFKVNLRRFVHPPTTLQEALAYRNLKAVRKVLVERFDFVAKDEYSWLREWDEMGYSLDEIAEFLLEDANDAPWIYFDPDRVPSTEIQPGVHTPGCVHRGCFNNKPSVDRSLLQPRPSRPVTEKDIRRVVEELCGLAGIAPISRDLEKWTGNVRFEAQNSVAIVSYAIPTDEEDPDHHAIVPRITYALHSFCVAVGQVQAAGLCCDCFTILRHRPESHDLEKVKQAPLELWRMDLELPVRLLEEFKSLLLLDNIVPSDALHSQTIAIQILKSLAQDPTINPQEKSVNYILHLCSLAVQFLCLGFLSYSQAHIGALQPFFLDSPQRKVLLMGNQWSKNCEYITAELTDLTCVGKMTRGPVLAFSMIQTNRNSTPSENQLEHDLLTSAEDLLDTWGPGNFIMRKDSEENPCAINIGGGIVCTADNTGNVFHWSRRGGFDGPFPVPFDPCTKIVIGALVTVNEDCSIDETKCWQNSCAALENLGTYGTHWEPNERQSGVQFGPQYVLGQLNQTWCKIRGKTLKQFQLEQEDDLLIPFLENAWGLQVSFCTSVARRIPLRELVADVLPIFANTLLITPNLWDDLITNHSIIDAFHRNDLRNWLTKLAPELRECVLKLVRRILEILQHTGVDAEGKHLTIAWPQEGHIQRCFKIPCERQSFWARLLADSEDCATFAYVSAKCLESEKVKCSGPPQVWQNVSTLLETAVIRHQSIPSTQPWMLEHKKLYFFRKLDSFFLVKVHRPDEMGSARLVASQSTMQRKLQQRFIMREEWKGQCRLRERQAVHESAEQVLVLTWKAS